MSRKNIGEVKIFEKKQTEMIQVTRFLNKRKCDVAPNLNLNKVTNKSFVYGKKKKKKKKKRRNKFFGTNNI